MSGFLKAMPILLALLWMTPWTAWADITTEVCIVGGGSGGYCAAIAAARAGAQCVLIEQNQILGGTSTAAYVCNWEPGPGGPIAREIFDRLSRRPNAVGISRDMNADRSLGTFGLWLVDPEATYEQTLRRAKVPREQRRAVVFDPDQLHDTVMEMLAETGRCDVRLGTTMVEVQADDGYVRSILVETESGKRQRIQAQVFIDATGGAALCRLAGCETMLGPEAHGRFGERSAPEVPDETLNAISRCYRIRRSDAPERQSAPSPTVKSFPRSAHVSALPDGHLIINPLAMLPGRSLIDLGYAESMRQSQAIVEAQWHWLQAKPTFRGYELHSLAPMLGIRESYRVVTQYVLTQHDLEQGLPGQRHKDIVAIADHTMDVHGQGGRRVHGELTGPYGIPYRCLVPRGTTNLLVACRGAGFSHVAASSCRLSRTIMQLGNAAGLGAAMSVHSGVAVGNIDTKELRRQLQPESRYPVSSSNTSEGGDHDSTETR